MSRSAVLKMLLVVLSVMQGCKDSGKGVGALYRFPDSATSQTKDVVVQVNVAYLATVNGQLQATVNFADSSFVLNAFALDDNGLQVPVGQGDTSPTLDLPVTLAGTATTLTVILRLPVAVQPGPNGYAMRFQLKPAGASLDDATTTQHLDALRGGIQAGTAAESNPVDLSIATSVAYTLVSGVTSSVNSDVILQTYTQIAADLKSRQADLESSVDLTTKHNVNDYVSGMIAALSYQLVTDKAFQGVVANRLLTMVNSGVTDAATKTTQAETLANSYTQVLQNLAQSVKTTYSDATAAQARVFTASTVDVTAVANPQVLEDAVFAPSNVAFTDVDATAALGGGIVVSSAAVSQGVASYNIYFGGETRATSKTLLVGNVASNGDQPVTYALPSGTVQPDGASRFWAYPMTNGTELDLANSVSIVNLGGAHNPPQPPTGMTATAGTNKATIAWQPVTGASSYNIYWSTVSPVSKASRSIIGVTSGYVHLGLVSGQTYYYTVSAVSGGLESALSTEASVQTARSSSSLGAFTLTAAATGNQSVTLTWSASSGASSYTVKRGAAAGSHPTTVSTAAHSPFVDTGLTPGTTYYYMATAVSSAGSKDATTEASATPNVLAPTAVTFTDTDASVTIGGAIAITAPSVVDAVTSYAIYFGGDTAATAHLQAVGSVAAATSPRTYTVTSGTAIPSGATRFWVFPKIGSQEYSAGASVVILNHNLSLSYATPNLRWRVSHVASFTPTLTDLSGTPTYSVSPSLPDGITISSSTGVISGTPLSQKTRSDYTVSVTNGTDTTSTVVHIDFFAMRYPAAANNVIRTMAVNGSLLYMGGSFTALGTYVGSSITFDPSTDQQSASDGWPLIDGTPTAFADDPGEAGAFYVAGPLTSTVAPTSTNGNYRVFRVTRNGWIDPNFVFAADGVIDALTVSTTSGLVYVGGEFTHVNGSALSYLAAVGRTTGTVDGTFSLAMNNKVYALTVDAASGNLVLGGAFTQANSVAHLHLVAVGLTSGTVATTASVDANNDVRTFAWDGSSHLYVGGNFTTLGGVTHARIGRLDLSSGSATTADFNSNSNGYTAWTPDATVSRLLVSNSKLYAVGSFTKFTNVTSSTDTLLPSFAEMNLADSTLASTTIGLSHATAVAVVGSKLYVGGTFTYTAGHGYLGSYLAAFDATTESPVAVSTTLNNSVSLLGVINSDRLYLGGAFQVINAVDRQNLGVVDLVTGDMQPLNLPFVDSMSESYADKGVFDLKLANSNLYITGNSQLTDSGCTRLAVLAVDPTTGVINCAFNPPIPANSGAQSLGIANGNIYVAGGYLGVFGQSTFVMDTVLNATTGAHVTASNFVADSFMMKITTSTDGSKVAVAGNFNAFGSASAVHHKAVIYNTDDTLGTAQASTNTADAHGEDVDAMLIDGNDLFVGGNFEGINANGGGSYTTQPVLAKIDMASQTVISPWAVILPTSAPAYNPSVNALGLTDSTIYVGGDFTVIGAATRAGAAAFDRTTGALTAWNPGFTVTNYVNALGKLYLTNGVFVAPVDDW